MSRNERKVAAPRVNPAELVAEVAAADRSRRVRAFLWIVGLALVARAIHLFQAQDVPLFEHLIVDARQYDLWARRISAGDWMGTETFYQAPLYPYFLAVLKIAVGDGLWPVRVVQALLGALSCGFLFLAGRNLVSHKVGVVAGVILALYPPAIFYDGLVQKASLGGFLVVLLIWIASRLVDAPSRRGLVALGATMGLVMLTREETILFVPALVAWIVWQHRGLAWSMRGQLVGAFVLGLAFVLTPVAWRNHRVGGEFVLTTSQAGTNFFIGNRPGADGRYAPLRPGRSNTPLERADAVELAEIESGRKLTPKEVSDFWFDQSFAWIGDHPGDWLALLGKKALLLVNWYEVPDAEDQYFYERFEPVLAFLSRPLNLGVILPLGAAGLVLAWPRRRTLWIFAVLLGIQCVAVVMFYVMGRYRYPIVPFTILFAAMALVQGLALARAKAWRECTWPLVALAIMAVPANWPLFRRDDQASMSHVNAGAALRAQGRFAEAIVQYRAGLALDRGMPEAWSNLGEVLAQSGRLPEGLTCIREAVNQRPDDPRFQQRYGTALYETGDAEGAIRALTRSTELFAADPEAWVNLCFIYTSRKDWARAVDTMRRGYAANPQEASVIFGLANLLARCPDAALCDGTEAVRLATLLDDATGHADPEYRDLLAAALARSGRYEDAKRVALEALTLAERAGRKDLVAPIRAAADAYAQNRPVDLDSVKR